MNLREFRRILSQTLLVPVIVLLTLATALVWQVQVVVSSQRKVTYADRTIGEIHELERLIIDQETGLRGYQLTGEAGMLAPYNGSVEPIHKQFDSLQQLVADTPAQVGRLGRLRTSYESWQGFADAVLALTKGDATAHDPEMNQRGKVLMDEIRRQCDEMLKAEAQERDQQNHDVHVQVQTVLTVVLVVALFAGIFLGYFTRNRLTRVSQAYQRSLEDAQKRAEDLFQSRQWLQTTLESIGDAVISCDSESLVNFMNPMAEQLTGMTLNEVQGKPLDQVFHIVSEETREPSENPVERVRRENAVVGLANHTVLLRPDGSEILIDDSAAPIRSRSGEIMGVVLIFRDVTEARRTQSALIASEKLAVAGRLAASIAHEIHNPLDSVANLHFLMAQEDDPIRRAQYLDMAQQELGRTMQISQTMLSLYREPKAPILLDLKEMMNGVLLLLERNLKTKSITVDRDFPQSVNVHGFPAELRQVFTNLIVNAMDAAGQSGRIRIGIAASTGEDHREPGAIVEISDSGPGVSEQAEKKLFQPFFTTKGEQGTGLGLWVSMGIVQKHGGTIRIGNGNRNGLLGAVVRVYLPLQTQATPAGRATPHLI